MSHFPRNRYDSKAMLAQFLSEERQIENGEIVTDLHSEDDDISFYVQDNEQAIETALLTLKNLSEMDNLIQKESEEDSLSGAELPSHFIFDLMRIEVSPDKALFSYYGRYINTEWTVVFSFKNGKWYK